MRCNAKVSRRGEESRGLRVVHFAQIWGPIFLRPGHFEEQEQMRSNRWLDENINLLPERCTLQPLMEME